MASMRRNHLVLFVTLLALLAAGCQLRLGNRDHSFGNELLGDLDGDGVAEAGECVDPAAACAGTQPFVWGSINSPHYQNENGDPYSSRCLSGTSCSPNPNNPEFRPEGYTYGIEVAEAGQTVTVEIYDAPAYACGSATSCQVGVPLNYPGDSGAFRVGYGLFREDGSDVTASTDPALSMAGSCDSGPGGRVFPAQYQMSVHHNRWWTLCTFTADAPGTYPLVVRTSDLAGDPTTGSLECLEPVPCVESTIGGSVRRGINSYAVRATAASGPSPVVAAIGDMGIYTPTASTVSEVDLVEVPSFRAGQRLVVDLYDPGDGNNGTYTMSLRTPTGATPSCTLSYGSIDGIRTDPPEVTEPPMSSCSFVTRNPSASPMNRFNNRWVRLVVDIPSGYGCTDDCWWRLRWQTTAGSQPTDRLTAAAAFESPPAP